MDNNNIVSEELELKQRLRKVQFELNCPKGQFNKFGKYKYRSCEDILESVKPLLNKYELLIIINDSIEIYGNRFYIKATVNIHFRSASISASALAREPEQKKGMDEAQITGATSSYARKYALNAIFSIDDTKDSDTMDNSDSRISTDKISSNDVLQQIKTIKTIDSLNQFWSKNKERFEKYCTDEMLKKFIVECKNQKSEIIKHETSKKECENAK